MPKISIIVPVYNVASFLCQCIDSLLMQSLKDIEIILVDDGSNDGSGEICNEYATIDNRIKVLHKTNGGLSSARNDGIRISTAPYIMFVDSDDWVAPDFSEKPFIAATQYNAELTLFSYSRIINNRVYPQNPPFRTGMLNKDDAFQFNTCFAPAVWLGLYRRELFTDICFPDEKIHEDYGTTHRLIHAANSVFFLNENLYNYRIGRPGSIDTEVETRNHPDMREMRLRRIADLTEWGYAELANNDAMYLLIRYGCTGKERLIEMATLRSPSSRWQKKILRRILCASPAVFDAVCIAAGKRIE